MHNNAAEEIRPVASHWEVLCHSMHFMWHFIHNNSADEMRTFARHLLGSDNCDPCFVVRLLVELQQDNVLRECVIREAHIYIV